MKLMLMVLQDVTLILASSAFLSLGFIAFGQPPLLGYIVTGMLVGPTFGNIIENMELVNMLGEFGLILLLFLVGLELSLEDFKSMWKSTLFWFLMQIICSAILTSFFFFTFDWSVPFSMFVTFILILSSTAIVVTLLENLDILSSKIGTLSISLLIAQDLSLVPMMLLLRGSGSDTNLWLVFAQLTLAITLLVGCVFYFGQTYDTLKKKLEYKTLLRKPEIATLLGGCICFVFAALAELFSLSAPYGAFLAGLILGNRWDRHLLVQAFVPITGTLMMVFFISVGMKISLIFILTNFWILISVLLLINGFKFMVNISSLKLIGWPVKSALFGAALLSQISEFSFILTEEAIRLNILSEYMGQFFTTLITLSLATGATLPLAVRSLQQKKKDKSMLGKPKVHF